MARNVSVPSFRGPGGPGRRRVRFHLVHEHGEWVLHAQEEHTEKVHSKILAVHASCSVLHTNCFGPDVDVGLKIRRPEDFVHNQAHTDVPLLILVLAAQARDMGHSGWYGHGRTEEHVLKLQRGYVRLIEWLLYHPSLTVPLNIFNRIGH